MSPFAAGHVLGEQAAEIDRVEHQRWEAAIARHVGARHVVVTDVRMPPGHSDEGIQAARRLRETNPGLGVVVLSQYVQHSYAGKLLASGSGRSVGYLLKDRVLDAAHFMDALDRVPVAFEQAAGRALPGPLKLR